MKDGSIIICIERNGKDILIYLKAGELIPDLSFIEDIEICEQSPKKDKD